MNVVALVFSQLIPLALGGSVVALLVPRGPGAILTIAGFGYLLGLVFVTLILRALSFAGVQWNFLVPAVVASVCAASLVAANRKWSMTSLPKTHSPPSPASRGMLWILGMLLAVHIGLAFYEAILRPLYPWDAAAQWATKARVWYDFRHLLPFVDDVTWLRSPDGVFTDAHPTYPATVPLFQTWAAIAWGSWDDTVANISWPVSLAALAAAVYGQLRRLSFAPLAALASAYAIASLPFVDVHAALAGYADLVVAAFYGLAFLALARWLYDRSHGDIILFGLCAIALPLLKSPGWAWLVTLIAGVAYSLLPRRVSTVLVIGAMITAGSFMCYAINNGPVVFLGYIIQWQDAHILRPLLDNLYVFANWHLLWVVVPLLMLADWRRLLAPNFGALTTVAAAGTAFLTVVFFFSSTGDEGVEAYTTLNRALLHFAPALVIYAALLARDLWTLAVPSAASITAAESIPGDSKRAAGARAT